MAVFEVKLFKHNNNNNNDNQSTHYKAYWTNGCYYADNLRVEINADDEHKEYISGENRLESVIGEAELYLMDSQFGYASIYDGQYRVATVTKKVDDFYAYSKLTTYGKKCANNEH